MASWKKENNIGDESHHPLPGVIIHRNSSVGFPRPESKSPGLREQSMLKKSAFSSPLNLCMFLPTRVLAAFLGAWRNLD
jgi:hypothetical protein